MTQAFNSSLLEIFHEEALELTQELDQYMTQWENELTNLAPVQEIRRLMHTLKGSARMVKFSNLADFCHRLEDLLVQIDKGELICDREKQQLIKACQIAINEAANMILQNRDLKPSVELLSQLEAAITHHEPSILPNVSVVATPLVEHVYTKDKIRLTVDTIEKLSKLAANASIARAHLEQQQDVIVDRLDLLKQKIASLEDALEDINATKEQALTHDLFNVTQDISTVLGSQAEHLREQQRDTYSLEDKLTRVRMVSFSYLVPRLQSMVTQIAQELGKKLEFQVVEMSGEMDRSVLERLMGPFEHLLRNAIDHGIESAQERLAQKKSEIGTIALSFVRRGAWVMIKIRDDGHGLDVKKIRKTAIKLGYLEENTKLSDKELFSYILMPGFSTRDTITQISGRGIGLDVVNSEVKKLGGNLLIDSIPNKETVFSLRLPLSLSLNKALIFEMGDQLLGVLLSNIEGITRMLVSDLRILLSKNELFIYAQNSYHLHYVGEMLQSISFSQLENNNILYMPILLVKMENYSFALIVDKIIGVREIVVKTLGRQLVGMHEILGASLLGDGCIVLVLDVYALAQKQVQTPLKMATIFVVDDSATIRKATKDILEKNNYNVMEAQDGVIALTLMANEIPDVVLLDLDMPNMGGLEVIERMKANPRLAQVVIVVITSRSSAQEKKQALDKGAHFFFTKPVLEETLLTLLAQISI